MSPSGGDTRFLPERELPGDARLYTARDGTRERSFEPLPLEALSVRRDRGRIAVLGSAAALIGVVVVGLAFWLPRPSPAASDSPTIDPAKELVSPADPEDEARLLQLLPSGYPAGSCIPAVPPKDALAHVNCEENSDLGGPLWATYTLIADKTGLDAAFDDLVHSSTTIVCPGNIQSPGP